MLRSFRLRIGLLSLCLSGMMLVAFGLFAVSVLNRVGIERIDRELRALADTQVRREQPRDHWRRFDESLRSLYGTDASRQFVVKATSRNAEVLHATADWPLEVRHEALPLPLGAFPTGSVVPPPQLTDLPPKERELQRPQTNGNPVPPPREMDVRGPVFETLSSAGGDWRAMTMANQDVTLSIAINLAGLHAETRSFRRTLFIGVPLGLLLLATGGWIIGHLTLRPVDRIARTAEAMTVHRLDARIPDEDVDEEFRRLINVINGMLERLDRSFHQATRFSADAAHELKTPLAVLQAQIERSLQRAADASTEQREYAEQLDEVQRLKAILHKLLLLSQADAGQLPLDNEDLNLGEFARAAAADVELLAPDRNTTVDAPAELIVRGDAHLVNHVIGNLVSNAVKFGKPGGLIDIKVEERERTAGVTVANSGSMIPLRDRERIFERFYRVDPSRSRETEGAGLGLSLAREIARAHGGDLTLQQSDEDLTRFEFVLPRH